MSYKYLFGPVASRRLGISLGIDLIPYKTCSMDCIYCECGKTTVHTNEQSRSADLKEVLSELEDFLSKSPQIDYVTFAGSGEPLLYRYIDEVIIYLKENFPENKIAVLSNSLALLDKKDWSALSKIDMFVPSLDAISKDVFKKINRPCLDLDIDLLVNALAKFKQGFLGKFCLEIFLLSGINDHQSELIKLKEAAQKINPDLIQINTLDRPGTEDGLSPISFETALKVVNLFEPLKVEIVAKNVSVKFDSNLLNKQDLVIETLKRRPSTKNDLLSAIAIDPRDLEKLLLDLKIKNKITTRYEDRGEFYFIKN